jgi:hypothetical protein
LTTHDGSHEEGCFGCKIRSLQWSPSATPSRRNTIAPRKPQNHWERGIAMAKPNMPLLDSGGNQIGLQELADRRPYVEEGLRQLKNAPAETA